MTKDKILAEIAQESDGRIWLHFPGYDYIKYIEPDFLKTFVDYLEEFGNEVSIGGGDEIAEKERKLEEVKKAVEEHKIQLKTMEQKKT